MEQVLPAKVQSLGYSYISALADMALAIRDCTSFLLWVLYTMAKCNTQVSFKAAQVAHSIQPLAAYVTGKQGTQREARGHILITFVFGNAASTLKCRHWSLALIEFHQTESQVDLGTPELALFWCLHDMSNPRWVTNSSAAMNLPASMHTQTDIPLPLFLATKEVSRPLGKLVGDTLQ